MAAPAVAAAAVAGGAPNAAATAAAVPCTAATAAPKAALASVAPGATNGLQRVKGFTATLVKPPKAGAKVLRIGCLLPFSGSKANTGLAARIGIEMAVKDLAPGRLPGVGVDLACEDSQCVDVHAAKGAARLARANAKFIVGDICSGASVAAASVATRFQVPMVSPASTSSALSVPGDYFFR